MDLAVFTLIACAVEAVNVFAFNLMKVNIGKFQFNQIYTLSFAALLGMMPSIDGTPMAYLSLHWQVLLPSLQGRS